MSKRLDVSAGYTKNSLWWKGFVEQVTFELWWKSERVMDNEEEEEVMNNEMVNNRN